MPNMPDDSRSHDAGAVHASRKSYDIRERTFLFAVDFVKWSQSAPVDATAQVLMRQLLRAATSVGANVEEADGTTTAKDKVYKWALARIEAREARYWLRLLAATSGVNEQGKSLEREASELVNTLSALIARRAS